MAEQVTLSTVRPDFEGITSQLQAVLKNKASWLTLKNSSTGEILTEAIAMVGEYDQYSIMSALHETNLDDAHIPESIYTNCRFLGVRLTRKKPAQCSVTLQNSNLSSPFVEIPAYTQFSIEGQKYFNREPIVFNAAVNILNTILYQGTVKSAYFTADGSNYQTYTLEETDPWSISNDDIACDVNGVTFARSEDPIFLFSSSDHKFYENSLPTGQVEIKFGNGIYGVIPDSESIITFTYAVTNGSEGNNSLLEQKVSCSSFPQIIGETTSNSFGGGNEEDVSYYQQLGAQAGASNGRGIIRDDFKSLVVKYPGVVDCNVYGQAEIAPLDKSWMNVVGLMLLTESIFTVEDWKGLVSYLKKNSIFGLQYHKLDPLPVDVAIDVTIYLKANSDLQTNKDLVVQALTDAFKLKLGSLGKSLYASDIEDIILSTIPTAIDYIDKRTPNLDYVITKNQYINITAINVEAAYSERDSQTLV